VTHLEDELRDSLARQARHVSSPPPDPEVLADLAVRRAHAVRRRHRTAGATVVAVFVLLVGLGAVYLPVREPSRPVAVPSRPALLTPAAQLPPTIPGDVGRLHQKARSVPKLPVDVVADDQLVTVDGSAIDVSFAGEVSQAYRVADGWLVVGEPERAAGMSIWLLTADGHRQTLLSGVAGVAFDVVGRRVAWRSGPRVYLGGLRADGQIQSTRSAVVDGSAVPVGFAAGAVLLARGRAGGYDVWWPDRGIHHPAWAQTAVAVYGSLADGRTAVGQVVVDAATVGSSLAVGERHCLALFDTASRSAVRADRDRVAQAKPVQTRCGVRLSMRSPGWVSPDGRWLVTSAGGRTVLVDLTASPPAKPQVLSPGPPIEGGVAWLDKQTVVLTTSSGKAVMRLRLDELRSKQADRAKSRSIPVVAKEAVLVVPRL
jgi:hypothetical protein